MKKLILFLVPFVGIKKLANDMKSGLALILAGIVSTVCYALSVQTNTKGTEKFFAEYPEFIQGLGAIVPYIIDPIAQLSLAVAIVYFVVIRQEERPEVKKLQEMATEQQNLSYRLINQGLLVLLLSVTVACAFLTWGLSQHGGSAWAEEQAERMYKPAKTLNETLAPYSAERARLDKEARYDFNNQKAVIEKQIASAQKEVDNLKDYASRGMWTAHANALNAQKKIPSLQADLAKMQADLQAKLKANAASHESTSATEKQTWEKAQATFEDKKTTFIALSNVAVNIWSIAGLLTVVIIALLTYPNYEKEALIHIVSWYCEIADINEEETAKLYSELTSRSKKAPDSSGERHLKQLEAELADVKEERRLMEEREREERIALQEKHRKEQKALKKQIKKLGAGMGK
jgi:hypothetical protein